MNAISRILKGKNFAQAVRDVLSSKYFPFFTALLQIVNYYLGWDMVNIYYMAIISVLMLLFLDDLTPLVTHLPFFHVIVSKQHSPSEKAMAIDPGYFMRAGNLAQIIVMLTLVCIAIGLRLFVLGKGGKFRPTPIFVGVCVLSGAFLLNGAFMPDYSAYDFVYGLIMAAVYLVIFVLISSNTEPSAENYEKIGFGFLALSAVVLVELAVIYIVHFDQMLGPEGQIDKEMMVFGWGIWNSAGLLFVLCIPPVMLLATRYKHGYWFIFYATVLAVATFLTTSRQSMIGCMLIYPVSLLVTLLNPKYRKQNLIMSGILFVAAVIVLAVWWKGIMQLMGSVFDNIFDENGVLYGNGRLRLVRTAMNFFAENPIFGNGFTATYNENDFTGLEIIPEFACNTFAEILASCGLVGFLAYLVHRAQTFIELVENPSFDKMFLALAIAAILILSLFDNHMFLIIPTMIYSGLLGFAIGKGKNTNIINGLIKRKEGGPA